MSDPNFSANVGAGLTDLDLHPLESPKGSNFSDPKLFRERFLQALHHDLHSSRDGDKLSSRITQNSESIIKFEAERAGLTESYLSQNEIALILVGGTAAGTMGSCSDVDLVCVRMHDGPLPEDLGGKLTKMEEGLRQAGVAWSRGLYTPQEIGAPAGLSSAPANKRDLERVRHFTHFFSARPLLGPIEIANGFLNEVSCYFNHHAEELFKLIRDVTFDRHAEYDFSPLTTQPNAKNAAGGVRDLDTIRWITELVGHRFGEDAANSLLSPTERSKLNSDRAELLWHKVAAHSLSDPNSRSGSDHDAVNRLDYPALRKLVISIADTETNENTVLSRYYQASTAVFRLLTAVIARTANLFDPSVRSTEPKEKSFVVALELCRELQSNLTPQTSGHQPRLPAEIACKVWSQGLDSPTLPLDQRSSRLIKELLGDRDKAGLGMRLLFEAGALDAMIPNFSKLKSFVQLTPGTHHRFTLGEHAVTAVELLDRLNDRRKSKSTHSHQRVEEIVLGLGSNDRLILSLAFLVHDLGRVAGAKNGGKSQASAAVAVELSKELELSEPLTKRLEWLVANHLKLWEFSQKGHTANPKELKRFLKIIPDAEHLGLLYLFTYLDKVSANENPHTTVRMNWINRVERLARENLGRGTLADSDELMRQQAIVRALDRTDRGVEEHSVRSVRRLSDHLKLCPVDYSGALTGETIKIHAELAEQLVSGAIDGCAARIVTIQPRYEMTDEQTPAGPQSSRIAVVGTDKLGLFSLISGSLAKRQINIIDAHIYTREDGIACNVFGCSPLRNRVLYTEDWERIVTQLETDVRKSTSHIDQFVGEIKKKVGSPLPSLAAGNEELVLIDTLGAPNALRVVIKGPDHPGFAAVVGRLFAHYELSIDHAKLGAGNRGIDDVFFLKSLSGKPIHQFVIAALRDSIQRILGPDIDSAFGDF